MQQQQNKVIFMNDNLSIIEEKKTIFRIDFNYPNPLFVNSFIKTKLILGASVSDDFKLIKFKAKSVNPLIKEAHLNIPQAASLLQNLVTQLIYLNHNNYTILGYHPENIIVINDKTFIYINNEFIKEIDENDEIQITSPFSKNDFFLSPELSNITNIPSNVHYKTTYYSLAYLIIILLINSNNNNYNESINQDNPIQLLNFHPIKNTKMYWFLSRCLYVDPSKRTLLFI